MTEDSNRWDLLLEQWKTASQLHRHMDQMAWQTLSYFAALNGALLSVFSVILSSQFLKIPLRAFLGLLIAVLGFLTSRVWSKVHKRMQMYHCLRSHQTNTKEQALKKLALDQAETTEAECMLVYDDKPLECHQVVRDRVPRWTWGGTANYALVFRLAIRLMKAWIVIFCLTLALFIIALIAELIAPAPPWAVSILSTLFITPIHP